MSDARRLVDSCRATATFCAAIGVSTIDYVEQLMYLLFLKMAHERGTRPLEPERIVPAECLWQRLPDADGDELEATYRAPAAIWLRSADGNADGAASRRRPPRRTSR
ncbi:MAG: hypothetical protein WD794_17350 [Mycobacteriales bacterium]